MSRVLALTRQLPYPPDAGDRVVTYGFLRALARRGHGVHVLAYEREDDDAAADALASLCGSVARVPSSGSSLPPPLRKAVRAATGRSDVMAMFDSEAFRPAAAERIRDLAPDVVLAQHPYVGQVFLDDRVGAALAAADADPVTSAHVVEYAAHRRQLRHAEGLPSRLSLAAEVPRLRREELAVYDRSARTLVLGREDLAELSGVVSGPVRHQRVGLDVAAYDPAVPTSGPRADDRRATGDDRRPSAGDRRASAGDRRTRADDRRARANGNSSDGDRLVFFGSYDWFPNADAARYLCERVFPAIRAVGGDAELLLAGRGADDGVAAYGDREGITFVGEVDDLAGLVGDSAAVVAPLRVGGGTRIKVLESMAWGVPVVTTTAGFEGVEATPGEELHVADDVDEFAAKTAGLLARPDERARMAANARELVERRYSIPAVAADLERNVGLDPA